MDELQEFIIECKNQILQLTDNYLDNLKEIKSHIRDVIPEREGYSDNREIELIKLAKLIDDIEQSNIHSFSENLIYFDIRRKLLLSFIETLNKDKVAPKLVEILKLFVQGYSRKEIAEKLKYPQATIRSDIKRLGAKIQNNKYYEKYIRECKNINQIVTDDNTFYDIDSVLKDLFEL